MVNEPKTRKIAIVIFKEYYHRDYDDTHIVPTSITDWSEVSESDYNLLLKAANYPGGNGVGGFTVIERPKDESLFVQKTIAAYIDFSNKEKAKREKSEKEAKRLAEERRLRRLQKKNESKLQMLNKLKEELHKEGVLP